MNNTNLTFNLNTIIAANEVKRVKFLCHQMAMDDPATILKGIASLPKDDQHALRFIRAKAIRFQEIARRNNLG